jgi:outer membrane protein TolC
MRKAVTGTGGAMSRKRWIKRALAGFLALGTVGTVGGCKQQLYLEPEDYKDALRNSLPPGLEDRPHDPILPGVVDRISAGAATVLDTNRTARMITLKECIAIALEQGATGVISQNNFGLKNDQPGQFTGRGVAGGSDAVRVFAIEPAIAAAELERSLSKFDVRWVSSMTWQKVDQPTPAQFLSFQNSRDAANFTTTLAKPLPTGGVAGITFSTDYSKFDSASVTQTGFVNPNYTPRLQFTLEQPLLRLFGVEVNQLSPSHPGSALLNVQPSGGQGTEGILVSRIRLDQQRADFETRMNYLLVNVEAAYWNLYAAYYNLYAQEEGMRQAFEGYQFIDIRARAGNEPPQNVYQARAQFERFRGQVIQARGQVLDAERQLRGMMNLRSDDGNRLVPIDQPNEAPYAPDFYAAANEAIANRPELLLLRQELKAQQLNLLLQKNLRQADLRSFFQYDVAGLGTRLDGDEFADPRRTIPGNAMTSFGNNDFNSWTIGFRLDMPLGFRDANAAVREAQLTLARSYYQLRDSEMKFLEYLVSAYRRLVEAHALIGPRRAEREALQIYLGKVREVIEIGNWNPAYYQNYLTVQQQLAVAVAAEFRVVADYNTALAIFEFAKGTVQQYNNVTVGEGPLPPWVCKKATDHIRERTQAALKLRERDVQPPPGGPAAQGGAPVAPPTGTGLFDSLPPFAEKRPPVPDALPDLKSTDPKAAPPKPMPPIDGKLGVVAWPAPAAPPRPTVSVEVAPQDYFIPSGTAKVPASRTTTSTPATTANSAASATAPATLPQFPVSTGAALPVPPTGGSAPPLPVPPATNQTSPLGGLPPIPTPPETRYPSGNR